MNQNKFLVCCDQLSHPGYTMMRKIVQKLMQTPTYKSKTSLVQ